MSTTGFHITEDCAEVYLQNESGMEFLQLARRLHDYLQHDAIRGKGLAHFDCWASTFGETQTAIELAPEGYTLIGR